MHILVTSLPSKPEDCLFYRIRSSRDDYSGQLDTEYYCTISNARCNFNKCDKLMIG